MWCGVTIPLLAGSDLYGAKNAFSAPALCQPGTIRDFPPPDCPFTCTSHGPFVFGGFGGFSAWRIIMILLGGGDDIELVSFGRSSAASRTLYRPRGCYVSLSFLKEPYG